MAKVSRETVEKAIIDHQSALIGYANSILKDYSYAKDVVQDTFMRLTLQDTEKVSTNLKAWLYRVCRNRCLDHLRKKKSAKTVSDDTLYELQSEEATPAEENLQNELNDQITAYIEKLTDNQKEVIKLKFHDDLSYREISEVTGLTESNVGFLIHSGIKRLREWMNEY